KRSPLPVRVVERFEELFLGTIRNNQAPIRFDHWCVPYTAVPIESRVTTGHVALYSSPFAAGTLTSYQRWSPYPHPTARARWHRAMRPKEFNARSTATPDRTTGSMG